MKRIWSLCALLALLCALTIPAMAAAGGETSSETSVQTLSEVEGADESEENSSKIRKIWAVAGLIGVTCFAGALGMSRNILKAAQQIAEGVVEQIDCGKVEQIGRGRDKHPDKDIYFVNIFSFGLFTTTSQHTSEHLKHRIGRLAYVVAAMRDLRNLHSIPLTITTDNETFYYQTLMGLVFNGETAGRVPLASKSSLRDGVFDCLFLRRRNLILSVFDMVLYILGIKTPAIRFLRTSTLVLATCIDEDTDVDGQRGGEFPMRVVCLHGELNVVCPQDRDTD